MASLVALALPNSKVTFHFRNQPVCIRVSEAINLYMLML